MKYLVCCALLLSLSTVSAATAEVFKYTDDQGKTYFVSDESHIPERYRAHATDSSSLPRVSKIPAKKFYRAPVNQLDGAKQQASSAASSARKVEIYVTSWCPYCKQLESFLQKSKIKYVRYDVEQSEQGRKFYSSVGKGGVPITKVGKSIIRGFSKEAILRAARQG